MEIERWAEIEHLYHAALELHDSERAAFLAKACLGDEPLRREVESLLASDAQAGSFIESPAIEVAARSLAAEGLLPDLSTAALKIGTAVSHYSLITKIGRGGMGVVYRARDTKLGRDAALKFLPEEFVKDPQKLERFRREAWAASALSHPNICTIYEIGEHEGHLFIAMELVEGKTLAEKLKGGPLAIEEVVANSRQIAEALDEAHEHNIVHRDLKPANVMVTPKGRVKILDFGLAKLVRETETDAQTEESLLLTHAGAVMGTVPYMAPEQLSGEPVDARTDLYALGELMYEMATGQRPFLEPQTSRLISAILTRLPRRPSELNPQVSEELEAIIVKAMEKDPAKRYQSARELMAGLGPQESALWLPLSASKKIEASAAPPLQKGKAVFIGGLALAVLSLLVIFLVPAIRRHILSPPSAIGGLPVQKELAVFPFSVIGGDTGDSAFSRGLAETLAAKLTQISSGRSLRVVPVQDLSARNVQTARDAQKVFGVNLVLTGSLERAGDRFRISYALVDPKSDRQIRADTLTVSAFDPFGIEDQVVEGTAGMLGLIVRAAERQQVESHGTQMAGAFQDYLKGLGYLQNYEMTENIDHAIDSFQSALKVDSNYTLAYAALGQAYWRKFDTTQDTGWVNKAQNSCSHAMTLNSELPATHLCLGIMESGTGYYTKATEEFHKVIKIEPTNAFAYEGLANAQYNLKRTTEAEATYQQAIAVRPHYWAPYNWLGVLYLRTGEMQKAAEMFKKVTQLAPGNHQAFYNLCGADYFLGKWDEAEDMCKKSIALRPSGIAYSNIGTVTFSKGHFEESAGYFEEAVKLDPNDSEMWGNLADAYRWSPGGRARAISAYSKASALAREMLRVNPRSYKLLGDVAIYEAKSSNIKQAMDDLAQALSLAPKDVQLMYNASIVFHLAGQKAKAFDYLRRSLAGGYPVESILTDPEWAALRSDPAFQQAIGPAKK
ncbi:MAG: tetratricopeptide repeat protein [Acidobacteria bacterium]|nr:MAG: tetratricopeptide repeat protein [Acidobacteriota bacterium]